MMGDIAAVVLGCAALCVWIIGAIFLRRQRRKYKERLTEEFKDKES